MAAIIFNNGTRVRTLKKRLQLGNGAEIASGVGAPIDNLSIGSIYLDENGGFYKKSGALLSDWEQVASQSAFTTKSAKNMSGTTIQAFSACAWNGNTIIPFNIAIHVLKDFAGIAVNTILDNTFGQLYKSGEIPVPALFTGTAGQQVLVSNNSTLSVNPVTNYPTDRWVKIGKLEPVSNTSSSPYVLFMELEDF